MTPIKISLTEDLYEGKTWYYVRVNGQIVNGSTEKEIAEKMYDDAVASKKHESKTIKEIEIC